MSGTPKGPKSGNKPKAKSTTNKDQRQNELSGQYSHVRTVTHENNLIVNFKIEGTFVAPMVSTITNKMTEEEYGHDVAKHIADRVHNDMERSILVGLHNHVAGEIEVFREKNPDVPRPAPVADTDTVVQPKGEK